MEENEREKMKQEHQPGITAFYSYAHEDEMLRDELDKHLSVLRRDGLLAPWYDRDIQAGTEWKQEIDEHLDAASLILLLISPDFLASDYCYEYEMRRAMERHERGEASVIPVILRPCDWQHAPFGKLQALPRDGQAITTWKNQDEAFLEVEQGLRVRIKQLLRTHRLPVRSVAVTKHRTAMLQRLEAIYQELLTSSLQETTWIDLGLAEQPGAVPNATNLILRRATQAARPLPSGTSIFQVYQEANQELLILGAPGAGKSTLLFQLGRQLLTQATADPAAPLPVLFLLSSWAQKRLTLGDWMIEELSSSLYRVPREQSQQWVRSEQILPLLDGLDEMEEEARPACIAAINAYRGEHFCPLIVCSRSTEYMASTRKQGPLHLQSAVEVLPLTSTQLDETLAQAGKAFAALRSELRKNPGLRELAMTPLWLNVLLLTFKDTRIRALPQKRTALQQQVFASYVQRMIEAKGDGVRYPFAQTQHWLSFLAGQMSQRNLTAFEMESLQTDWLSQWSRLYWWYSWSLGLVFGLVGALIFTLTFALIFAPTGALILILVEAAVFVLAGSLVGDLVEAPDTTLLVERTEERKPKQLIERHTLPAVASLYRSLQNGLGNVLDDPLGALFIVIGFVLVFGLVGALAGGLARGLTFALAGGLVGAPIGVLIGVWALFLGAPVRHFLLRFWLWCAGDFPLRAVAFLEDASARHLLRRLGGSYQFVHQLLLDYLAALDKQDEAL